MKISTHITIDSDLKYKARMLGINISNLVNNVLLGMVTNDEEIDIISVCNELESVRTKKMELSQKEQELMAQKFSFEEKQKNHEKEKWESMQTFMKGFKANNPLREI